MNDFGPSSSQNAGLSPHFFWDHSGQPLHIFVEASSIMYRPKLIRSLRGGGAVISHSPADAQIILVDPTTEAGMKFVDDWGLEQEKVVLDSIWARRSIEKGRPLLVSEGWGGLRVMKDGQNLGANSSVDIEQSPLPTPRQTPPEAGPSSQSNTNGSTQLSLQQHRSDIVAPTSSLYSQDPHVNSVPVPQAFGISTTEAQQPQVSQHGTTPGLLLPRSLVETSTQATTQATAPLAVPINLVATILDVMRHRGLNPANMQAFSGQIPSQAQLEVLQGHLMSQSLPQLGSFTQTLFNLPSMSQEEPSSSLAAPDFTSGSAFNVDASFRTSATPSDRMTSLAPAPQVLPPSLKRKTPSQTPPSSASSRLKGKERATTPQHPLKYARASSSPDRCPPSERRVHITAQNSGEVFKTDLGEAMTFVVQVDIRNRKDIVQAIKKNGGRIISEISQADIVVLSQSSKSFPDLLVQTENASKIAVQASFVTDCIEEGALLDEHTYSFEGVALKRRRGRHSTPSPKKKDSATTKKSKGGTTPVWKEKVGAIKNQEKEESQTAAPGIVHSALSPPPPMNIMPFQAGKNFFSPQERAYFQLYVPILLSRDPDMSLNAIARKMWEKMPHHSTASWNSFVGRQRGDIENCRKKAFIALRKAARDSVPQELNFLPASTPNRAPGPSNSQSPVSKSDFQVITEFLADGGADNRTDDEVWATLADLYHSRTAPGWREYWEQSGAEINAEVQRLVGTQESQAVHPASEQHTVKEVLIQSVPKIEPDQ
ncbi:hypothetical protein AcV7_000704 [Taiwanofungus camphoratus]|nr:hypothetical protein AcV7_000704 [Antrodia cinnamomea]